MNRDIIRLLVPIIILILIVVVLVFFTDWSIPASFNYSS